MPVCLAQAEKLSSVWNKRLLVVAGCPRWQRSKLLRLILSSPSRYERSWHLESCWKWRKKLALEQGLELARSLKLGLKQKLGRSRCWSKAPRRVSGKLTAATRKRTWNADQKGAGSALAG
eukprot:6193921-Amphidinium_carterae.1